MVDGLHCILLKNIAQVLRLGGNRQSQAGGRSEQKAWNGGCSLLQAAIKLGHWGDALRASDDAIAIDDEAPGKQTRSTWVGKTLWHVGFRHPKPQALSSAAC